MKRLLFLLIAMIFAIQGQVQGQTEVTVGSGTTFDYSSPIAGWWGWHYSIAIYTAAEMQQGGVIQSISWNMGGDITPGSNKEVIIYIKEVTETTIPSTITWNTYTQDASEVFSSDTVAITTAGWKDFTLATPFTYTGSGNLMVIVWSKGCTSTGGCSSPAAIDNTAPEGSYWQFYQDNSAPSTTSPITLPYPIRNKRFVTKFSMLPLSGNYCFPPAGFMLTNYNSNNANFIWRNVTDATNIELKIGVQGFNPDNDGTSVIVQTDTSYQFTNLTTTTAYSVVARKNCTNGLSSNWSNPINFTTPAIAATLPYTCDFENPTENNEWLFINGAQTNKWYIGAAADTLGTTGLYISNDQGVTNQYTGGTSTLSRVYAYRDFEIPVGAGELELSFDWRAQGGSAQTDFLRMYLVPFDANITAGVIPPNGLDASAQIGNYTGGTGEHWLSQSTVWQHKTMRINSLQFPNLAGRTWRLLVHWRNESTTTTGIQPPAAVDNINLSVVTCPTPSALTVVDSTISSALLTWTENGSATDWIIEYKPYSATTWMTYQTTSNPDSIIGLSPSTEYSARLRSVCSSGDTSLYSNTISFRTSCDAIITLPWSENFDTYGTGTGTYPTCWRKINTYSSDRPYINSTNHSSPGSLYFYATSGTYNIGITPPFDLSIPVNTLIARFYYRNTNSTDKLIVGVMTDPTNASTFDSVTTIIAPTTATWAEYEINFNSYLGTGQYIAFKNEYTTATSRAYVDDLVVETIPACARPTSVATTNLSGTSVDVTFTPGNTTDNSWYVYYKPTTSTDWDSINATSIPATLSNLTLQTTYEIYVKTDCGSGTSSDASNIITYTTPCSTTAINTFPWTEGFENDWSMIIFPGNRPAPNCWTVVDKGCTDDIDYYWSQNTDVDYVHSGIGSAQCYTDYGSTSHNDWLITPQIELNGTERLRFWAMRADDETTEPDEISVYISDENAVLDTTGMGQYGNMPNFTQIFNQMLPVGDWQQYEVNLSAYTGNHYIAFVRQNTPDGYYLRLDDVLIDELPACAKPTNVIVSDITTNSVSLSWTNGNITNNSWYIYFKPTTSTSWDSIQVSSNPYVFQNLISSTGYDIYIKTDCSPDLSEASSTISFRTSCDAITTLPWSDSFDTYGTGSSSNPIMPTCWNRINTYSAVRPYVRNINHSAPASLYFYAGTSGTYNIAVAPPFDVNIAINTLIVRFYYMNLSSSDRLTVGIMTDPYDVTTFDSITTIQASTTETWEENEVNLSSYTGTGKYIAFKNAYTTIEGYAYIDDVIVDVISACTRPTSVATINGIGTSVDLTFTPGNVTDNSWYVYYKPITSTTWDSINATSIPVTLSNLSLQTTYEIYVKTDCGSGTSSNASNIITYTTPCNASAINTFPWMEGFENGLNCWQQEYVVGTVNWTTNVEYPSQTPVYAGTGFANIVGPQGGDFKTKLISPLLDLTSLSSPYISFWHMQMAYSSYIDDMKVFYRTDANSAWVQLLSYPASINTYQKDSIALPNPSATYQIAFEGHVMWGYGVAIDEIKVYDNQTVPCADPINVTVPTATITNTTATVNWTAGGSETSWQVRLGTTGTPVDVNTTSYQLTTGLAPGTSYTVYVRANCGGTYSSWVSQTFTTTSGGYQLPIVTTIAQTGTNQSSTTLNGSYVQGTNSILVKGFEWKPSTASTWTVVPVAAGTTPFSYPLSSLIANTSYDFRAYVETSQDTTRGNTMTFTTLSNVLPNVTTLMPNPIGQTTATLNGTTAQGTESIMARGFEYKLTSTTTWTNPIDATATGTTTIIAPVTGLAVNTQYDVRAYAQTQSDGRTYGNILTFTTLDNVIAGHATTQAATNIDTTHAVLHGTLVDVGNALSNIEVGFVYSTITDPELGGANVIPVQVTYTAGMTTFDAPISGLQPSTSYFFKAYVKNSAGSGYGLQETFVTDSSSSGSSLTTVDLKQLTVNMYPNPATSTTKLVVSGVEGETHIAINDVQGKLIYKTTAKAVNGKVEKTIDVNNFAKGVYYVRIQNQTTSRTQKLIVLY